jgi:hypothetical protein
MSTKGPYLLATTPAVLILANTVTERELLAALPLNGDTRTLAPVVQHPRARKADRGSAPGELAARQDRCARTCVPPSTTGAAGATYRVRASCATR